MIICIRSTREKEHPSPVWDLNPRPFGTCELLEQPKKYIGKSLLWTRTPSRVKTDTPALMEQAILLPNFNAWSVHSFHLTAARGAQSGTPYS